MSRPPLNILIIGAGIAGCAAAISLTADGHQVNVVEKQDRWRFQSSGIFVYGNGLVSMRELGILDGIISAGFIIPGGVNDYFDQDGALITQTIYPEHDNGKVPAILGIKRGEMHRVMAKRIEELGVSIRLGTTVTKIEQEDPDTGANVSLSDGSVQHFDLVIGADGVRSATRSMMGFEAEPRYTGFGVWRAVHDRPDDLTAKIMIMGQGQRFGIMPISSDKLYTFGTVVEPAGIYYEPDQWAQIMKDRFSEIEGPARPFLDELKPDSEILYTAVEEIIQPLPWHRGNVVLIGDAAHASTPFMGQGGALAMQDALILTRILRCNLSLPEALETYGKLRLPVCEFVQEVSRKVGEAGANEDFENLAERNAQLHANAQSAVDGFYRKLAELNEEADQRIKAIMA